MKGKVSAAQKAWSMRLICEQLGIPILVDSREVFQANIVDYLVAGYSAGITPSALLPVQQDGEVWPDGTVCP